MPLDAQKIVLRGAYRKVIFIAHKKYYRLAVYLYFIIFYKK
jgi:hypothetical protein